MLGAAHTWQKIIPQNPQAYAPSPFRAQILLYKIRLARVPCVFRISSYLGKKVLPLTRLSPPPQQQQQHPRISRRHRNQFDTAAAAAAAAAATSRLARVPCVFRISSYLGKKVLPLTRLSPPPQQQQQHPCISRRHRNQFDTAAAAAATSTSS